MTAYKYSDKKSLFFSLAVLFCLVALALPSSVLYGASDSVNPYDGDRKVTLLKAESLSSFKAFEKLGWLYMDCMVYPKALESFISFVDESVKSGNYLAQGRGSLGPALTFIRMNNVEDAKTWALRAGKVTPWPRGPFVMALMKMVEAEISFNEGKPVRGIQLADEALSIAAFSGENSIKKRILFLLGNDGPSGTKRAMLLRALLIEKPDSVFFDITCRTVLASFERSTGKLEKALSRLITVAEHLQPGLCDKIIFIIRKEEGKIRMALGRKAGAIQSFVLARNSADRLCEYYGFGEVTLSLAECCIEKKMQKKAREYLEEAIGKLTLIRSDKQVKTVEKDKIIELLNKLKSCNEGIENENDDRKNSSDWLKTGNL